MRKDYPKLVAFAGGMASGKDTYGQMLIESMEKSGKSVIRYSFASPLKDEIDFILSLIKSKSSIYYIKDRLECTYEQACFICDLLRKEVNDNQNVTASSRTTGIRKALQYWGTDVRRAKDKNYWVNKAKDFIQQKKALQPNQYIVITDARFKNEFRLVQELGGTLIRLECSLAERLRRIRHRDGLEVNSSELNHSSEQDYLTYQGFDYIINTEDKKQEEVYKDLEKELIRENGVI